MVLGSLFSSNKPRITSNGGGDSAHVNVNENTRFVTNVETYDAISTEANGRLRYSIIGGADAHFFEIDQLSGKLFFKEAPDFETPRSVVANDNIYDVKIQVKDAAGYADTQILAVKLLNLQEAPEAQNDVASVTAGQSVNLNVLSNDRDPDGDALRITSLNGWPIASGQAVSTANGSVTLQPNGQLSFVPNAGFVGSDVFSYHVNDGKGGEDIAQVQVTVSPQRDPKTGFIGNRVFFDANQNGIHDDGEGGFGGVRVTLTGAGQDGVFGTGDDISRSQIVNASGYYGFANLAAGNYKVGFSGLPNAFSFTAANVGNHETLDSDVDPVSGMTEIISLAAGEFNSSVDAGVAKLRSGGKIEILGSEQANWPLTGTKEDDNIFGLGGNDKIEALDGDDHLTGGSGNDHLYGGQGDDSLNGTDDVALGRWEVDNLTGGVGGDRFILGNINQTYYFGNQWGDFAIVNDFTVGEDLVVLHGSADQYVIETNLAQNTSTLYRMSDDVSKNRDAIAVFNGNTNLSFSSPSFEFINDKTGEFGFQSGSYPPLVSRLTQGQTPANLELMDAGAIVNFSNSIIINVGFDPTNNDPAFSAELRGETQLLLGEAEDAIVNNPLLGNLGTLDGRYDVSKSEIIRSSSTGQTPLGDVITVNIGDGSPDLAFNSIVQNQPPLILQAGGSFSQDDPLLGSAGIQSSYQIFLEIQDAPNGTLRNRDPIVVESDFDDSIYSGDQLNLKYSSGAVVPLYAAGPDGAFWTGDEWVAAKLVPGSNGNSLTVNLSSQ